VTRAPSRPVAAVAPSPLRVPSILSSSCNVELDGYSCRAADLKGLGPALKDPESDGEAGAS